VAAGHSVGVDPARWQAGLDELLGRVARRFGRVEPRQRAKAFVLGLLAELPRKNCWTIAEHAGDPSPDGMQHLLARAGWDHDAVRDDVRACRTCSWTLTSGTAVRLRRTGQADVLPRTPVPLAGQGSAA
jgi:SRSO17 transposase